MGNPRNPFFTSTLELLSERIAKLGKQILIFTAEDQACVADVKVEDLLKFRVDVLLLMSANLSPQLIARCRTIFALSTPQARCYLCAGDYIAMATVEVARYELSLAVGRELGVVGFDGIE
jgi:DNA-binding LacI/PurR family transcriptional regulator